MKARIWPLGEFFLFHGPQSSNFVLMLGSIRIRLIQRENGGGERPFVNFVQLLRGKWRCI